MLFIDIHESHYLRFARLYSFLIIRMLTNHTFVLTTPSWNITLLDKYYHMSSEFSTKFDFFIWAILYSRLSPLQFQQPQYPHPPASHRFSADVFRLFRFSSNLLLILNFPLSAVVRQNTFLHPLQSNSLSHPALQCCKSVFRSVQKILPIDTILKKFWIRINNSSLTVFFKNFSAGCL